eukprot:gene18638-24379_t
MVLENVKEMWTEYPKTGKGAKKARPRNENDVTIESPSLNSRKITASILIDGTIDDVWSILTDYNNLATHVPNLVRSYLIPSPTNSIRLFQEGAQRIIGFDFKASVVMDMIEEPVDDSRALQEKKLSFKLVESIMFANFEGTWSMKYANRSQRIDPITQETITTYKTLLTYTVLVKPKGVVPVIALEWRIKEDIPPNLRGIKLAAETIAQNRRQNITSNRNRPSSIYGDGSNTLMNGWRPDETL